MPRYKLNAYQKRLPFGGHHFTEDRITIKGDSVADVADLLENYRIINGRPVGNPYQEIVDYYSVKFPWMVNLDQNQKPEEALSEDYLAWREWVASVWGKPNMKLVSRKEASMRLEVCKTCPHNAGKPSGEPRETTEFQRKAMMLRRGEKVDENLCYCRLHKADISVSSFVESPSGLSRKDSNKPDHPGCWFSHSEGS